MVYNWNLDGAGTQPHISQAEAIKLVMYTPQFRRVVLKVPVTTPNTPRRQKGQGDAVRCESRQIRVLNAIKGPHLKVNKSKCIAKHFARMKVMQRISACIKAFRLGVLGKAQEDEVREASKYPPGKFQQRLTERLRLAQANISNGN
jgi:hypothetical protein